MYLYDALLSSTGRLDISMVYYLIMLAHWLSLWYPLKTNWSNGNLYCTLLSFTGSLVIRNVHYPLLLTHWISLWYTILPYWHIAIPMVHYYLLLAHCQSVWYTTLSYWPTGYLYGTLLSSTGPLDISMVHFLSY